ncbi:MAG: PAS domain S-box protein [Acidobacteria bacterium]|jgi:PAS domain S-box-containing protein|nr:PAS domain S-box protein [Acidobacteriota bacterium]
MRKLSLYAARPALLAAGLALAILALDLLLPEGFGVSFLYIVVVTAALWSPRERFALAAALGITVLIVADLLLSPSAHTGGVSAVHHVLAAAAVWATALLVYRHKLVEQTLLREEAEAQAYLDVAAVAILVLDREGRVGLINRRGCEILGLEPRRVLGRPWVDSFVSESHRERTRHRLGQLIRGELAPDPRRTFENRIVTSAGDERLVAWHNTVLRDSGGSIRATVSSGEDITEQRKIERRLRAQESLAKTGQLAAVVAHEVRNPLAGIRGAIQVLSKRMAEGADRAVMDRIVDRVDTLNALTEDLLLYARPHTPEIASIRLEAILRVAERLLSGHADLAAVSVEIRSADVTLEADEKMLQDVFLNLFLNAAQAMKGEGTIRVAVRVGADVAQVDIEDNGPGIPPDVRDRLFEPFFTTRHRGTGLGLPIVKRDVEAHGGEIAISHPEEGGTRVTVSLPLEQRGPD